MKKLYLVFALRRSGRHAVKNWLCRLMTNAIMPTLLIDSKLKMRREDVVKLPPSEWFSNTIIHYRNGRRDNKRKRKGKSIKADIQAYDNVVVGLEDCYLQLCEVPDFDVRYIVIVRDPYNWLASFLLHPKTQRPGWDVNIPGRIAIWKEHVREALGETNVLGDNVIFIDFSRWVKSEEYRKEIAVRFDLEYSDKGLDDVLSAGDGSTFDGIRFDGKARQMKVLERYRDPSVVPLIRKYIDDEMIDLGKRYFGMEIDLC